MQRSQVQGEVQACGFISTVNLQAQLISIQVLQILIKHYIIISHLANTDLSAVVTTAVPTTSSRRRHRSMHWDCLTVLQGILRFISLFRVPALPHSGADLDLYVCGANAVVVQAEGETRAAVRLRLRAVPSPLTGHISRCCHHTQAHYRGPWGSVRDHRRNRQGVRGGGGGGGRWRRRERR